VPELPYVNFYCSDWLGDTKVRRMSHEQRGIHIDLLCHAWGEDDGAIPADPDELAHLLGVTRRKLDSLWPKVGVAWESNGNGGLVNPRLERERAKQQAKRNARKGGSDG
jgi:uncharacterized protein YdaU (DUF1376 family)